MANYPLDHLRLKFEAQLDNKRRLIMSNSSYNLNNYVFLCVILLTKVLSLCLLCMFTTNNTIIQLLQLR